MREQNKTFGAHKRLMVMSAQNQRKADARSRQRSIQCDQLVGHGYDHIQARSQLGIQGTGGILQRLDRTSAKRTGLQHSAIVTAETQ